MRLWEELEDARAEGFIPEELRGKYLKLLEK